MKLRFLLTSLLITFGLLVGVITSYPDNNLHLIFCDVGQGDAILAIQGKTQVLIDGGPNNQVLDCLSKHLPFWDKELELVILTHPESDHLTGLVAVLERYNVRQLVSNSLVTETGVFSKFRQEVLKGKIPVYSPRVGDKIKVGKLVFKILFPEEKLGDELVWRATDNSQVLGAVYQGSFNETVIVSQLEYGKFKALLTGDIGVDQERKMEPELEKVDVLKVAHHGSKYSTSSEFLEKVMPNAAIISVGAANRYGHPTQEVLERLRNSDLANGQARVLRTDIDGEVEIVSDGESWYTKNQ